MDFTVGAHGGLQGSELEAGAEIGLYYSVPKTKRKDQAIWEVPGAQWESNGGGNLGPFNGWGEYRKN